MSALHAQVQPQEHILDSLVERTLALFEAGPVITWSTGGNYPRRRSAAATIFKTARHTLLDWYDDGNGDVLALLHELWKLDLDLDRSSVSPNGVSYPEFSCGTRARITGLALSQAITYVIMQLEADPARVAESDRRHALRLEPQRLLPSRRRRRRASGIR